jgi:hypothetical protein
MLSSVVSSSLRLLVSSPPLLTLTLTVTADVDVVPSRHWQCHCHLGGDSGYYHLIKGCWKALLLCAPCYTVALAGWPPLAIAACGIAVIIGFVIPPAVVVWRGATKSLLGVPWYMYDVVYACDEMSSRITYGAESPLLCKWSEPAFARPRDRRDRHDVRQRLLSEDDVYGRGDRGSFAAAATPPQAGLVGATAPPAAERTPSATARATGRATATAPPAERSSSLLGFIGMDTGDFLNVNTVWDSFFVACGIHLREGLVDGAFKLDDLQDLEPSLYISVPALTIARALWVSV